MITLKINGRTHRFDGDPEMPLLWYLRDELNLKGTKFGCGMGLCGACTIHLNGRPVRGCLTPVSAATNGQVTTIEGLSADGSHPLQVAWQENDVPQCGYCRAGQIMAACALLDSKPKPTDAEIDAAMDGNLCRCGTYLRIRAAIHHAAELKAAAQIERPSPPVSRRKKSK
jgi:isoquinoline 1-oxidoreductase alpha subunit